MWQCGFRCGGPPKASTSPWPPGFCFTKRPGKERSSLERRHLACLKVRGAETGQGKMPALRIEPGSSGGQVKMQVTDRLIAGPIRCYLIIREVFLPNNFAHYLKYIDQIFRVGIGEFSDVLDISLRNHNIVNARIRGGMLDNYCLIGL